VGRPTCVRILNGLGDSIYHRPFLREHGWCLHTKYPELFSDLGARLGCEQEPEVKAHYTTKTIALMNTMEAIGRWFPKVENLKLDLPEFQKPDIQNYVVIRPPMLRNDFYAPSRNPRMRYIYQATEIAKELGYTTVGVAKKKSYVEWPDGYLPDVDIRYYSGELTIPELMGLVSGAKWVIGGPGWQVPAALAYKTPVFMIYGGMGGCNRWEKLTDPRIQEPRVEILEPDNFCRCRKLEHKCNKEISDFEHKFRTSFN